MKVSLITVCFNSQKTIESTILSVINQCYENIEYIIVDGGSIDNTISIIKKYENFISKFISEPDFGLYDALNKGILLSTGNLIGILNSDDVFYSSDTISDIVKFHKKNDIDASIGDIVQLNNKGKIIRLYTSRDWLPRKLISGFMPPHPSIFIKKEIFNKNGIYRTDLKICSDYEIIVRFFLKKNISWMYSDIITTKMLVGGISSSGFSSYFKISKEIEKALSFNGYRFSKFKIWLRIFKKISDFFYVTV